MKPEDLLSPEERLKVENELLRLKLELEHGMKQADTSGLNAELENSWLNNIYNFEQEFKNANRIRVYDTIGRPAFRKLVEMPAQEVSGALNEILSVMEEKGVVLDRMCPYEDAVIYKFITEELFECEMDDLSKSGMITHFTYEEFYPNHSYDLHRYSEEFIETLLSKKWNPEFDTFLLSTTVTHGGNKFNNKDISSVLMAFQDGRTFRLDKFEIEHVSFDVEKREAKVQASLAYLVRSHNRTQLYQGHCTLDFSYDFDHWYINGFMLPGFC
jgi:hypothetical protein